MYWATLQKCVRVQRDCPSSALVSSYLLCELQANVKGQVSGFKVGVRFRVSRSGSGFGFHGRAQVSGFKVGFKVGFGF